MSGPSELATPACKASNSLSQLGSHKIQIKPVLFFFFSFLVRKLAKKGAILLPFTCHLHMQ